MAKSLNPSDLKKSIDRLQAALATAKKREPEKSATKRAADLKKLKTMMAKLGLSAADAKS